MGRLNVFWKESELDMVIEGPGPNDQAPGAAAREEAIEEANNEADGSESAPEAIQSRISECGIRSLELPISHFHMGGHFGGSRPRADQFGWP